jgi:hypothetical protein
MKVSYGHTNIEKNDVKAAEFFRSRKEQAYGTEK